MELAAVIILVSFAALVYFATRKSRVVQLIDKLPGPPTTFFFGNALQFVGLPREERVKEVMKRDVQYGPIYRNWIVSLPYVHICGVEQAEVILNLKDTKKGQVYTFLHPWFGRGLLTADGWEWARSRKLITPTFHFQMLDEFLGVFNENAMSLVRIFRKTADTGTPVNVYNDTTLALLDTINETAMGNKINALKNSDSVYVKAITNMLKLVFYRYDRVWLHSDWMYSLSAAGKQAEKELKILHGFTENVIKERKQERESQKKRIEAGEKANTAADEKKKAFLDLLLDECEKQNANFSDKQLRDEVNTFMFEGHDTTTAAMVFTMFRLAIHSDLQEELYQEQMAIQGDGLDQDWQPTLKELNEMKALERFIKESMRLHPPIPFISRTMTQDVQIGDYLIPTGSVTLISLISILRDPKSFPDPEKFDPDRFLPENAVKRSAFAHVPFSAGPRNCIGQRFALSNLKTFLSHIIRNFKLAPYTRLEDVNVIVEVVQKPSNPIKVLFESRNKLL